MIAYHWQREHEIRHAFAAGFDLSHCIPHERGIVIQCSQCQAAVINGVPCHEHRCPNIPRRCRECDNPVPRGESCTCFSTEEGA